MESSKNASIASKIAGMAKRLGVRPKVMMTGGVAKNSGVVLVLSEELGTDMVVPLSIDPQLVGALGAAFIAYEIRKKRVGLSG